jgi:uncharacterized membrane protein YfcA
MAIGTLAGLFSGLFGVGAGSVIVPLLVLWLGYEERGATATSLAAIVFIAAFAAGVQGLYGNVDVRDAALVAVPAIGGVLIGTWLQQRLQARSLAGAAGGLALANAPSGAVLRDAFAGPDGGRCGTTGAPDATELD